MTIRAIISRAEAKARELKRYFTGIPCLRGHVAERFTNSGGHCVECNREKSNAWSKGIGRKLRRISGRKHRAANVETARERTKKWHHANRDASRALVIARRATKKGVGGRYTKADIDALLIVQGNQCLCGSSFDQVKRTIDHIVPLSRGGFNWPFNIQLLCMPCNDSKGTKLMSEWTPIRRAA